MQAREVNLSSDATWDFDPDDQYLRRGHAR
jgi:hypothetical protein